MEYTEETSNKEQKIIHPNEYEKASNSYLMAIVAVIVGVPLPVINITASVIYYLGNLKSSYFVRWHCIQAILAQTIMIPFNSIAVGWTISIMLNVKEVTLYYGIYLFAVILFNIIEFFAVIITASKVSKGKNVRWFLIANITDLLCSKKNKDPYSI
ncbi:hypothetical protein E0W68_07780 [Flavobacterium salilacus subsp. salilacus]|uniref:hypothetical protein n=1 Tax=Flavobacterium TaxID=237 RepID=UPI001074BA83|nr:MULTISPECIES: hypothetical protein [Flavobacterium]KAF2518647.1 hypothetical protein E0W68_07780 [Flavobacterium salilacus subsp. salilacus]MBE1613608.1 hypothetical protein [Flavobacterium sp. SaA2.13]